jgi:antitoxin component of RelBE/YafQ-DinJ toxin-antitoxin module
MNSTIMIQKTVKDLAAQKAKSEGLSLSTVARFLLQGYAEGKLNIGLVVGDPEVGRVALDQETQEELDNSMKQWRHKFAQ